MVDDHRFESVYLNYLRMQSFEDIDPTLCNSFVIEQLSKKTLRLKDLSSVIRFKIYRGREIYIRYAIRDYFSAVLLIFSIA